MGGLKTGIKRIVALTITLLMVLTMVPNSLLEGKVYAEEITYTNTTYNNPVGGFPNNYGPIISSDKASYELGEDIYIKVENSSSATGGGWIGIYSDLDSKPETQTMCWAYTGSSTVVDVTDYIIYGPNKNSGVTVNTALEVGTYYIILMAEDGRWAVLPIEITAPASISTDKDTYDIGEPIMVTATSTVSGVWVSLLGKNDSINDQSYYWYYVSDHDGEAFNLYDATKNKDVTTSGEYKLVVIENASDGYHALAQKDIFIGEYIEPRITLDKEGNIPAYKYGEPVMITAEGSDTSAWFGVYDYDPVFPDGYYVRFDVEDITESIDLVKAASDAGKPLKYGEKYRIYLCVNQDGNPNSIQFDKSLKFELLETYGDPTWQWDENYLSATATFAAKHDSSITKTIEVTGDGITSDETKQATEDEEGERTYTATITAEDLTFATENEPPFIDTKTEVIPKLDHVHDIVKVNAVPETCETAGNIEYYKCTGCGAFFEDEAGETEIVNKTSVVIPAKGHAYGAWTFNEAEKTHSRVCANDPSHIETEDCTFSHKPSSSDPDIEIYTCEVCGGQYEKSNLPEIKTDKEEYKVGEDILITTDLNGHDGSTSGGWIALYQKGQTSYGTSLLWYFPACFENPKLLQSVFTPSDTNLENMGEWPDDWGNELPVGEYELVFLKGSKPYTRVGQPAYFTVYKSIKSEEITLEPTCTESGNKHIVYDDDTEEDVEIPALGHDPKEEWVYDSEQFMHYHECSRCGEHTDLALCTFDEGKVVKEPTATEEGEMLFTCEVCGGTYTDTIPTLANQGVKRVYGSTRYQTAMLQANELKEFLEVEKFDNIIVATGTNYADALSGAYLGFAKEAPILLVRKDVVEDVKAYIKANLADTGTVYLLGGEAVVPGAVTEGLDGVTTKRLAGATRYETNIEILKEAGVDKEPVLVCDGTNFADSLSASAVGLPILLVKKGLNNTQRAYLDKLHSDDYYLVGGEGVLPSALKDELENKYGSVMRLGGNDRYETSVKVAKEFFGEPEKAVVAYAMNYPDGLCGGTLAAYMGAPLLLVRDDKAAITADYTREFGVKSGIVLGGSALVSDKSVRSIYNMADSDEIYVIK